MSYQIIILQMSWWLNDVNKFLLSFICLKNETLSVSEMKKFKLENKQAQVLSNEPLIRCFVLQFKFISKTVENKRNRFSSIWWLVVFENYTLGIVYFFYSVFFLRRSFLSGCFLSALRNVTGNINLLDWLFIRLRF